MSFTDFKDMFTGVTFDNRNAEVNGVILPEAKKADFQFRKSLLLRRGEATCLKKMHCGLNRAFLASENA